MATELDVSTFTSLDQTDWSLTGWASFPKQLLARTEDYVLFSAVDASNVTHVLYVLFNDEESTFDVPTAVRGAGTPTTLYTCSSSAVSSADVFASIVQVTPLYQHTNLDNNYDCLVAVAEPDLVTLLGLDLGGGIGGVREVDVLQTFNTPTSDIGFGSSIELSEEFLAVGARSSSASGTTDAGAVYIYSRVDNAYTYTSSSSIIIYDDDGAEAVQTGDFFGSAISYDAVSRTLFVGASGAMSVFVFAMSETSPYFAASALAKLDASGVSGATTSTTNTDQTLAVTTSGDSVYAYAGDPGNDNVYVWLSLDSGYSWNVSSQVGLAAVASDASYDVTSTNFGTSINGYTSWVVVGAPDYDSGKGAVFVFNHQGSDEHFLLYVVTNNTVAGQVTDQLGDSVAVFGTDILCTQPGKVSNSEPAGVLSLVSMSVCVRSDTLVLCENQTFRRIRTLVRGDLVWTRDKGYVKLARLVQFPGSTSDDNVIVKIAKDTFETNVPFQDLYITQGHPIVLHNNGRRGDDEFVDPADLARSPKFPTIEFFTAREDELEFMTLQFETHEVINVNGLLATSLPPCSAYRGQALDMSLYFDKQLGKTNVESHVGKHYPPHMLHDDPLPKKKVREKKISSGKAL